MVVPDFQTANSPFVLLNSSDALLFFIFVKWLVNTSNMPPLEFIHGPGTDNNTRYMCLYGRSGSTSVGMLYMCLLAGLTST